MDNYSSKPQVIIQSTAFPALMRKVYNWMTLALLITGLTAYYIAQTPALLSTIFSNSIFFYGLIIAQIGIVIWLSARIHKMSFATAGLAFALYAILTGITLSFIFLVYTSSSIATVFFITAATFATMSFIGYVTRKDLTSLGQLLMMALIGLIIASVVNIFLNNDTMYYVISYLGVLIFTGLIAYDTQKIKHMLVQHGDASDEEGQKLALLGSLSLYLDFINLFLYLLRIFGDRK